MVDAIKFNIYINIFKLDLNIYIFMPHILNLIK